MINIFQNADASLVKKSASQCLEKILIENSGKKILLLLSGGSALSLLSFNTKCLGNHLTIGVLDERYSTDPKINNFQQLSATPFFTEAEKRGCKFMVTKVKDNESIQDLALRFEKELRLWKKNNPKGLVIITQGMGPDGHTSGIMPYPENKNLFDKQFENNDKWVVGYDAVNKNQYPLRVTITIPFLKLVDISIIYISGKEKAGVLNKILSEKIPQNIFPITIIKEMKKTFLFTDITISQDHAIKKNKVEK